MVYIIVIYSYMIRDILINPCSLVNCCRLKGNGFPLRLDRLPPLFPLPRLVDPPRRPASRWSSLQTQISSLPRTKVHAHIQIFQAFRSSLELLLRHTHLPLSNLHSKSICRKCSDVSGCFEE